MRGIEKEKEEAIARAAKVIRDIWLREREHARAMQISANAEVRKGWNEFDQQDELKLVKAPVVFQK